MARKTIGIDLGHCETAAAMPRPMVGGDARYSVERLITAENNMHVVTTQIALTNAQMEKLKGHASPDFELLSGIGPFAIGDLGAIQNGERFQYFKTAPKDFGKICARSKVGKECGITHAMVMACYVWTVVNNIIVYNNELVKEDDRKDTTLLIGCPTTTDWTAEEASQKYADLVKTATGVESVRIIPESRAAMFSSVDNGISNISAMNGAVIFDFGSSTADCTYMLLGRKIIEFSWELGASAIERAMTSIALRKAMAVDGGFSLDETSVENVCSRLRRAKEEFYTQKKKGCLDPDDNEIACKFKDEQQKVHTSRVDIDETFMEEATGQALISIRCDSRSTRTGSWQQLCREFFREAKEQIERTTYLTGTDDEGNPVCKHCTVDTVVLTGGASAMDFIKSFCTSVFDEENVKIELNESNPSHTVSNGLAWTSIADRNIKECQQAAKKVVLADKSCGVDVLKSGVTAKMFESMYPELMEEVDKWANAPGDTLTLQDLVDRMNKRVEEKQFQEEITLASGEAVKEWKEKLSNSMSVAVNAQTKILLSPEVAENLILPQDVWQELTAYAIDISQVDVGSLVGAMDFSSLGMVIVKWIVYLAALVAIATGGILVMLAAIGGMNIFDYLTKTNLGKARKQRERQDMAKKIKKKFKEEETKNQLLENVGKQISENFKSFEKIVDAILNMAFKVVTLQKFDLETTEQEFVEKV